MTALLFPIFTTMGQPGLDKKIAEESTRLECPVPDEQTPVTLNAQLVESADSIAVIVKVLLAPGWHIYAYVPPEQPYISIDQILQLSENLRSVGQWKKTEPETSSEDPGVLIYQDEAVFIHKAVKLQRGTTGVIKAGLYYQTCNLRQCLPPKEITFELRY